MVAVVFRKDDEKLASMCMQKYRTVNAAKKYIEQDAHHVCKLYDGIDLDGSSLRRLTTTALSSRLESSATGSISRSDQLSEYVKFILI